MIEQEPIPSADDDLKYLSWHPEGGYIVRAGSDLAIVVDRYPILRGDQSERWGVWLYDTKINEHLLAIQLFSEPRSFTSRELAQKALDGYSQAGELLPYVWNDKNA